MAAAIKANCSRQMWQHLYNRNRHVCMRRIYARLMSSVRNWSDSNPENDVIQRLKDNMKGKPIAVLKHSDIVIVGGGIIGSAVAYFLKQRNPRGFTCTVIEKDATYTGASTVRSVGGMRQQFSLLENIKMSQFGAKFLREIKQHLNVEGYDPPDIEFNHQGYMFLAPPAGVETLQQNHQLQIENGAKVNLLSNADLRQQYPWLNADGIELATLGMENEGWFDPLALLLALKAKAIHLGTTYVEGEVVGFRYMDKLPDNSRQRLEQVEVLKDGVVHCINAAIFVNCAGAWSGEVAEMAGIGSSTATGVCVDPLPVEPRKRYVYVFHCPDGPGLDMPFLIDPMGVYVRREGLGGHYVCGLSADPEVEPSVDNLDVDHKVFEEKIWPVLAHRVPAFKNLKVTGSWAGFYDYNYADQSPIIGNHPYYNNMFMATGCTGHGLQLAPAIGRAIMELIVDDEFKAIDLNRFSFDRFLDDELIFEKIIM